MVLKSSLKYFFVTMLVLFIVSCSGYDPVTGVWETIEKNNDFVTTHQLVFASNNRGLSIQKDVNNSGETISSAVPFNWKAKDNTVILLQEGKMQKTYILNAEGELVLREEGTLVFKKISEDFSKYL